MKDFRGPLPLDDRDFAEVRREVLAKIDRKPRVWTYALAAAAMIALVVLLWPRQTVPPTPQIVARPHVETGFSPSPVPQAAPKVTRAKARLHIEHKPKAVIASAGAPPSDSEITMNIQTADPNVRIIWISR